MPLSSISPLGKEAKGRTREVENATLKITVYAAVFFRSVKSNLILLFLKRRYT